VGIKRYETARQEERRDRHWGSNKWKANPSYNAKPAFSPSSLPSKLPTVSPSQHKKPSPFNKNNKRHKH
jgi:hypothetical protein